MVISLKKDKIENIKESVLTIISEITGYSIKELEDDMYLESDLGFDSIKMINLMNQLMKLIPETQIEAFTEKHSISALMTLDTIGDVLEVFENWVLDENQKNGEIVNNKLEILNSQYPFLASYWAVGTITICSGIKIRGELNLDYLMESYRKLINENITLKAYFKAQKGATSFKDYEQLITKDTALNKIKLIDIRGLSSEEKEKRIKENINNIINKKFDIFKWPLHNITVIRTENFQYEIIFSNSHLISDGLGNQKIIKKLLNIYSNKLLGKEYKSNNINLSLYNETVNKINSWRDVEEKVKFEEHLKIQNKNKYLFNPMNKNNTGKFAEVSSIKCWIESDTLDRLVECAKKLRVSLFTLLVSAYIKTIVSLQEEDKSVILNLPTSGKVYPNIDASEYIGCFAQNLSLNFSNINKYDNFDSIIRNVDIELKKAITSGFDREQVYDAAKELREKELLFDGKMTELTSSFIRSSLKSNLYLSFIGNNDIDFKYGDLDIVDYGTYTSTNSASIDNVIEIFQKKLFISSNYDSLFFKKSYIENLIAYFIEEIENLSLYDFKLEENIRKPLNYNVDVACEISNIINETCFININDNEFEGDLEAEFGIDSLERIRIITKIIKTYKGVNRDDLFDCRTVGEMAVIVENGNASAENLKEKDVIQNVDIKIPFVKIIDQCIRTPKAVAISYMDTNLTYAELDSSSNKLANYLRDQEVKTGSLIGIMTLPGPLMLIGMLGILKAGAAYVPIDPNYPVDRIEYILNNANIEILISEQELKDELKKILRKNEIVQGIIFLDEGESIKEDVNFVQVENFIWKEYSDIEPSIINKPDDLMLIIYTSGSTGNPKGVMLTHEGYMNRLSWHQKMFQLKAGERVAQKTSCCFDISIWELFWPLMYGGIVCPVRKNVIKNPWKLAQWMIESKINIMHFVPSLFGEFVNSIEDENYEFKDLRCLIYSGEALPMSFIQKWIDKYGMSTTLTNLYGPTEASIDVTYHVIKKRPGSDGELDIPIGKPLDNVYILNLDENMNEVKDGDVGELWIGGVQIAKGYLNNDEKTNMVFKPNPFKHVKGKYIYKTGDLTCKNKDGSYEYHGRIDNQVKIRGFRVELGEIEAILHSHAKVREAAVIALDYGLEQKRIVACLSGSYVEDKEIKELVGSKVPEYMIPHTIKWMEELPKTPNGKTDRKALSSLVLNKGNTEIIKQSINSRNIENEDIILPLAPAQKWLMTYFEYPYQWAGFTRFKFKQALDFESFNKSLTFLADKHEILRCELMMKNNKWVQKILPKSLNVKAEYYDATNIPEELSSKEIDKLIINNIEALKVDKWPLWKTIVVKITETDYDISVIGHHLISDVVTNQILFDDMWKIYSKVLLGETPQFNMKKSYVDFIRNVEKEKKDKEVKFIKYWKNKFPNEDSVFNIQYDFNKGPNNEDSSEVKSFALNKELTSLLLGKAKKYFKSNVYCILLAPLYEVLSKTYNSSRVVVSHRMHGRDLGNDLYLDVAGDFAVNFPIGIGVEKEDSYEKIINNLRKNFEEVPLNGVSYDVISEKLPFYMYPDFKITPVRANYLGNRNLINYKSFEFSKENLDRRFSMPNGKRTSGLEFFFSIVDGILVLNLEYSTNLFKDETIETLGNKYIQTLTKLISKVQLDIRKEVISRDKEDKVVVITGGGRGIGKEIAIAMAKKYSVVVIIGRTHSDILKVSEEIEKLNSIAYPITADVTDLEKINREIEIVIKKFGKIDILVNNAGITKMSLLVDTKPKDWKAIINTNLFGTYNLCYAIAPCMIKQQGGKIINIGSDSSLIGYPLMTAYAASKHAILGLTKALSEELKLNNIQVNAVCPALVATDMAPHSLKGKAIHPSKVAEVVMFLASKEADCITGETIQINGKQDMYWFGAKQMKMLQGYK